jgi:hypothetical protein
MSETGTPSVLKARDALRLRQDQHQQELLERQTRHNEGLRERFNRIHFGEEIEGGGADEMGDINVDSPTTHNHYHGGEKNKLGTFAKLAIAAGLIAAGAGIPFGASVLGNLAKDWFSGTSVDEKKPEPSERVYRLDLGDPVD